MNNLELFLQEVLSRLDPSELYSHPAHNWKPENQRGSKWRGGCPWHSSSSGTSFYVDFDKNYWRCPACDVGGSPIKYYWAIKHNIHPKQELKGQEFIDFCRELSAETGVAFPERKISDEEKRYYHWLDRRRVLLEIVQEFQNDLLKGDLTAYKAHSTKGRSYLRQRGFTREQVDELIENPEFQLGFMPDDEAVFDELLAVVESAGYTLDDMIDHGLVFQRKGKSVYFLADRIIVPWRDPRGQMLTQYGRSIKDDGKKKAIALPNPKQWNLATKNTPLMFHQAVKHGHKDLVSVEGLFDVLAAQLHGDHRVVAWVAFPSQEQIKTIQSYSIHSNTFCLDPDEGGYKATYNSVLRLAEAGITTFVAPTLPDGKDPDEFIGDSGIEGWRKLIDAKKHSFRWIAHYISKEFPETVNDADRLALVDKAKAFATRIAAKSPISEQLEFFWEELKALRGIDEVEIETVIKSNEDLFEKIRDVITKSNSVKSETAELEKIRQSSKMSPRAFESIVEKIREEILNTPDYDLLRDYIKANIERFDPYKAFPKPLADELVDIAQTEDFDVLFYVQNLLPAVSALIGTRSHLHIRGKWIEPAVLWTAVVGRPGSGKSPTQDRMFDLLLSIQKSINDSFDLKRQEHERLCIFWEGLSREQKQEYAGDPMMNPNLNKPGHKETLVISEGQIEAVLKRLYENQSIGDPENRRGTALILDELLSLFMGMDQFKAGGKGNSRQHILSLYTPKKLFPVERAKQADSFTIENPRLIITGGIQPNKIHVAFDAGDEDGMLSRFLVAEPSDPEIKTFDREKFEEPDRLYEDIYSRVNEMCLGNVHFSEEAMKVWGDFYSYVWVQQKKYEVDFLVNYYAKLCRHVARLALVLHHIEHAIEAKYNPAEIDVTTLNRAIYLGEFYVRQLRLIHAKYIASKAAQSIELMLLIHEYARDRMIQKAEKTTAKQVSGNSKIAKKYQGKNLPISYVCELLEMLADQDYGTIEGAGSKMTYSPIKGEVTVIDAIPVNPAAKEQEERVEQFEELRVQFEVGQMVMFGEETRGQVIAVDEVDETVKVFCRELDQNFVVNFFDVASVE